MKILINSEIHEYQAGTTVTMLLESRELAGKRLAVEINEEILPRSAYDDTLLADGDSLEIVHAIGGG